MRSAVYVSTASAKIPFINLHKTVGAQQKKLMKKNKADIALSGRLLFSFAIFVFAPTRRRGSASEVICELDCGTFPK